MCIVHDRCELVINELIKLDFNFVNKNALAGKITLSLLGENNARNSYAKKLFELERQNVQEEIEEAIEELKRKKILTENHNGFVIKTCKQLF